MSDDLQEAAERLRAAAEFLRPEFAAMFCGLAQRMDMQDAVDYDESERQRIFNCARALLGDTVIGLASRVAELERERDGWRFAARTARPCG